MRKLILVLLASSALLSCRKNTNTTATPSLDSPAYSFFPGMIGANNSSTVFTNDGNIGVLGTTHSGSILLLKLSLTGNELFRKEITLEDTSGYGAPTVSSLVQTSDNGYLLCGTAYVHSTYMGSSISSSDLFILKLNSAGNIMWSKTFGGNQEDYGNFIIRTHDGNYVACGTSYSFTAEPYNDIYLVKINQNGDLLWATSYAKHEQQTPFNLLETKNGNYVITGTDEPTGDGRIVYLLGVDAIGNKQWDNSIGPVNMSHWKWGYCSAECSNGDLMVCGMADAKTLLARTNATGNMLWEKTFLVDSYYSSGLSIKFAYDNTCFITGGSSVVINQSARCFLLRTDADGNQLFLKQFPGNVSTSGANLLLTNSHDVIITGYQYPDYNTSSIFFTRTDMNGNYK